VQASLPISYCGPAPDPSALLARWNADPVLLGAFLLLGLLAVRTDSREGKAGVALAALLYVSPFCAWGASLFSVRVVHHLVLTLCLAPLAARAVAPLLMRAPGGLPIWTLAAAAAMWAWHAPSLYNVGATTGWGYWVMQFSIFVTATLFWNRVERASGPSAIVALLAAMVAMGALGAVITLAPEALYAAHYGTTAAWAMAPLEDQQLAGLLMWAPASIAYLAAALVRLSALTSREARA
jgi:putative membrane protein